MAEISWEIWSPEPQLLVTSCPWFSDCVTTSTCHHLAAGPGEDIRDAEPEQLQQHQHIINSPPNRVKYSNGKHIQYFLHLYILSYQSIIYLFNTINDLQIITSGKYERSIINLAPVN